MVRPDFSHIPHLVKCLKFFLENALQYPNNLESVLPLSLQEGKVLHLMQLGECME